jgi:phage-related protein
MTLSLRPVKWGGVALDLKGYQGALGNTISGIVNPMGWTVETLNATVDAELAALPADIRARFVRIAELIGVVGLPNVREPHVKHIRGPIWEIRLQGKAGIARALYVTASAKRVVVLRAFAKKTQRTPAGEIDLALQRAKELET